MPVQTTYPGVYVEERPSGVHTIVGVSTSVTAFVGAARMGPTNQPVRIDSMADYLRTFGAPWDREHPMGHAVSHYFANGGSQAIVVRTPADGATSAKATLTNGATSPVNVLSLSAIGEGAWATRAGALGMDVAVDYNTANPNDLMNLVLSLRGVDPRTGASVLLAQETYANLSMAPLHPRYALGVLAASSLVKAALPAALSTAEAGTSKSGAALKNGATIKSDNNVLRVAVDFGPALDVVIPPSTALTDSAKLAAAVSAALAAAGVGATAAAVTAATDKDFLVLTSKTTGLSSSVVVLPAAVADASKGLGLGLTWGGTERSGAAGLRPAVTAAPAGFGEGTDGGSDSAKTNGVVTAAQVVPVGRPAGIYALASLLFPRFNLLCLPDVPATDPTMGTTAANTQALGNALSYCRDERAFLIVDTPRDLGSDPPRDWKTDPPALGGLPALGQHGAVYYPRLRLVEQGPGGTTRTLDLPPCGAVAGVIARTDATRGVWKAPAGLEAGIVGASGLTVPTDDVVSGRLNPRGVNVLRTFPAAGTVVWGARTLKGDDSLGSEFKYVPVRRTTDFIASSLYLGTQFAVFEPNDPDLWGQLRLAVGTFMRGLFRQGAFQQSSKRAESDSFFVICDETVNPQSEIDLGRVNVVVGFAPLKPAEFVIVTITQISKLED